VSGVVGGRGAGLPQSPVADLCPPVAVSCPDNVDKNFELHAYASVSGAADKLKFHWTVTWPAGVRKGRIKSGQGTPSLVVSVPRRPNGGFTRRHAVQVDISASAFEMDANYH
jgi:hypothetical protein